jgi:hypothetical protein
MEAVTQPKASVAPLLSLLLWLSWESVEEEGERQS